MCKKNKNTRRSISHLTQNPPKKEKTHLNGRIPPIWRGAEIWSPVCSLRKTAKLHVINYCWFPSARRILIPLNLSCCEWQYFTSIFTKYFTTRKWPETIKAYFHQNSNPDILYQPKNAAAKAGLFLNYILKINFHLSIPQSEFYKRQWNYLKVKCAKSTLGIDVVFNSNLNFSDRNLDEY